MLEYRGVFGNEITRSPDTSSCPNLSFVLPCRRLTLRFVKHSEDFDPSVHDPIWQEIGKLRHPQLVDTIGAVGWVPEIGVINQIRGAMNNALHDAGRHILARDALVIGENRQEIALGKGEPDDFHNRLLGSTDVGLRRRSLTIGAESVRP